MFFQAFNKKCLKHKYMTLLGLSRTMAGPSVPPDQKGLLSTGDMSSRTFYIPLCSQSLDEDAAETVLQMVAQH